MTIETKTKDIKIELTDGIKVFQYLKGVRSKLTTDDVDNGDFVVVFGQYDSTIDILKATVILIDNSPKEVWINGVVKSRDEEEFTITLTASDSLEYLVDVEKTTKVSNWNGTLIEKSGFSKVAVGDTVHIIGTPAQNKEKRLSAKRIIDLGKLMPSPTLAPEISASDTESTPSPKASPKSSPAPRAASPTPRPTVAP